MKRERPAAVLVLAVLTVVVGALGVVSGGAGLALALGSTPVPQVPPPQPQPRGTPPAPARMDELTYLRTKVPGYRVFEKGRPVTVIVLGAVLLAAGIGLFEMHAWARTVAVAAAGATLLLLVLSMLYEMGFVLPSLENWRMEGYRHNYYPYMAPSNPASPALTLAPIVLLTGSLLFVVYAVVALVVLFLPVVRAAFAGRPGPVDPV